MDGGMGTHVDRMATGPVRRPVLHAVFVARGVAGVGPAARARCAGVGLHVCDERLSRRPRRRRRLAAVPTALTWGVGRSEAGVRVRLPLLGNAAVDMACDPARHVLKAASSHAGEHTGFDARQGNKATLHAHRPAHGAAVVRRGGFPRVAHGVAGGRHREQQSACAEQGLVTVRRGRLAVVEVRHQGVDGGTLGQAGPRHGRGRLSTHRGEREISRAPPLGAPLTACPRWRDDASAK